VNSARLLFAGRVALATIVGTLLALPLLYLAIDISGGGHGSNYGFCLYFAPSTVIVTLAEFDGRSSTDMAWCMGILIGLYGIYGGGLAVARLKGFGLYAVVAILCLHYGALAWFGLTDAIPDGFSSFVSLMIASPLRYVVIVIESCVGLHILIFQYALSTPPYRPRFTRPVISLFGAGLAASIALFIWGRVIGA